MSSALGRKKKRSKWGADLEAEPSATGVSLEGEALDAARIPADSQASRPDPLSTNWRTAELHSDALPNTLQSPVSLQRAGLELIRAFLYNTLV